MKIESDRIKDIIYNEGADALLNITGFEVDYEMRTEILKYFHDTIKKVEKETEKAEKAYLADLKIWAERNVLE